MQTIQAATRQPRQSRNDPFGGNTDVRFGSVAACQCKISLFQGSGSANGQKRTFTTLKNSGKKRPAEAGS
jgi:hypothetical protein